MVSFKLKYAPYFPPSNVNNGGRDNYNYNYYPVANAAATQNRRITFATVPTWEDFADKLEAFFFLPVEHLAIAYHDVDGDEITLSTVEEWNDFIHSASFKFSESTNQAVDASVKDLRVLRDSAKINDDYYNNSTSAYNPFRVPGCPSPGMAPYIPPPLPGRPYSPYQAPMYHGLGGPPYAARLPTPPPLRSVWIPPPNNYSRRRSRSRTPSRTYPHVESPRTRSRSPSPVIIRSHRSRSPSPVSLRDQPRPLTPPYVQPTVIPMPTIPGIAPSLVGTGVGSESILSFPDSDEAPEKEIKAENKVPKTDSSEASGSNLPPPPQDFMSKGFVNLLRILGNESASAKAPAIASLADLVNATAIRD